MNVKLHSTYEYKNVAIPGRRFIRNFQCERNFVRCSIHTTVRAKCCRYGYKRATPPFDKSLSEILLRVKFRESAICAERVLRTTLKAPFPFLRQDISRPLLSGEANKKIQPSALRNGAAASWNGVKFDQIDIISDCNSVERSPACAHNVPVCAHFRICPRGFHFKLLHRAYVRQTREGDVAEIGRVRSHNTLATPIRKFSRSVLWLTSLATSDMLVDAQIHE